MADTVKTFQAHLTAVMDSLVRASVCEITKLFEDTVNDYLVEISLNRKENEALKLRLRLTENKLRNERKYGLAWAASRRAASLLGSEETTSKKRKLEARGKLAKEWSSGAWEEGAGGATSRDDRRDTCRSRPPTASEEEEEERRCVSGERKEVASVKEELVCEQDDGYRCESVRLLQEALQMSESDPAQGELEPVSSASGSAVGEAWDQQPTLSAEPPNGGDDVSRLDAALKEECEREEAGSAFAHPSHAGERAEGVEFIGLDGLCSTQQDPAPSIREANPADLQLPLGTRSQGEEGEESGREGEDLLHFCPQCGGGFNSASDLAEHACSLAEERFQCSACGRAFGHAWSLKNHECAQASEQPHRCELCGKRFTHSRSLERHQLVHTGERPHRCPQCGRSFSRLGNLERHQRIHTGERPYECGACGKRFSRIEYLKRHQQIHSGERGEGNQTLSDTELLKRQQCYSSA